MLGLPPVFHLAGVDLLGFLLLWGAAATLIRSRTTAFDRLMISGVTLVGWTCALALIVGQWRHGVHPLTLAESTALVLVVVRALAGPAPARPGLPLGARVRALVPTRDHPLLLTSGLAVAFVMYPVLHRNAAERLALITSAEDLARHSALYDTILRVGGLVSLNQAEAATTVEENLETYPQGSHLILAVITSFLRNGRSHEMQLSLFVLLYTVTAAALAVAVLWAVHRAAGPALRGWRSLALVLPAGAFLVVAELPKLYFNGFISELFALGLLAVLVALSIRPLDRIHEQLVVMAALVAGISFGHYLLLPAAGATVLSWAVCHWPSWKRHRVTALAASVVAGGLAFFPIAVNLSTAGSAEVLTVPGGITPVGRHVLFPLVAATLAVLLTRSARADRARRTALGACGSIVLFSFAIRQYQLQKTGDTSYFYEKVLHQLLVIGMVTAAAAVLPLFGRRILAGERHAAGSRSRRGLRSAVAVLTATGCLLYGVVFNSQPDVSRAAGWEGSPGRNMLRGGQARWDVAERVTAIHASRPAGDKRVAVSLGGHRVWDEVKPDWGSSEDNLWLGVLNSDQGRSWRSWMWGLGRHGAGDILYYASIAPEPLRVYLDNAELAAEVRALARGKGKEAPDLEVSLLRRDASGRLVVEPFPLH
ncbi:hypothetical protein [Kitasatospora sp. NPDC056184]|uniref:hypothetical protein n=1 Tax=Kitasatospora sp. NPDC056184 TaxID=3345738 RepID=UPI0035DFB21D